MTQQELNNMILSIRCKAASLASRWSDKVKLGKWCEEQECALILADWASDIMCRYDVDIPDEDNCFTEAQLCEIYHKTKEILNFKCDCC